MSLRSFRLGYKEGLLPIPQMYVAAREFAIVRGSRLPWLGPKFIEKVLKRKYGSRVITPAKVKNFIQANRDERSQAIEVRSLPYHLNLDLYNVCNLRCRFCPTGTEQLERGRARLSVDDAKAIIDSVKEYVITFSPFHWGEPFLNPDVFEVLRYAHDAGMHTELHSNLSVKVPNLGARIVESGLDSLLISVDGLEQSTNEAYRRRVNNEYVFRNVRDIVDARRRAGGKKPHLEMAFLVFRHNEHEVPRLESMREELGVDSFITRKAAIYDESWIPEHPDFQPLQKLFTDTCAFLYTDLNVEPDGGISPCCINSDKRWDVGTVKDLADPLAFWNNSKYRAMRSFHRNFHANGDKPPKAPDSGEEILCHHCNWVEECRVLGDPGRLSPLPPALHASGQPMLHDIEPAGIQAARRN